MYWHRPGLNKSVLSEFTPYGVFIAPPLWVTWTSGNYGKAWRSFPWGQKKGKKSRIPHWNCMLASLAKVWSNIPITRYFSSHTQQRQKSYPFCHRHPTFTMALGQTRNMAFYRLFGSLIRHTTLSKLSYSTFLPARHLLDCSCVQNGRSMSCKLSLVFTDRSTIISLPLNAFFLRHILLCCSLMETVSHSWLRLQDQADSCENHIA